MPRFQVTAELNTSQAEKQLAALVTKIKEAGRALNDAGSAGGRSGSSRQTKELDATAQQLERMKALLAAIKTDSAKLGVENVKPGAFKDLQDRLVTLRTQLVALEKDSRDMWEPSEVIKYGSLIKQVTGELERLSAAQRGAAGRGKAKVLQFGSEDTATAKNMLTAIKELDRYMSQMESNRKAGTGTLASYRQELLQIERAARAQANNPNLNATERGLYAARADKSRSLINAADTAEAQKLILAVTKLKQAMADGDMTAERAGLAFARLAERARTLSEAQGVGVGAAQRYAAALRAAQQAAKAAAGGDDGLAAARAAQAQIRDLQARKTAGLIDPSATVAARKYAEELRAIAAASKQEAQNTRISTEARNAHARAAEQAIQALKRLKAEQTNLSSGGSAAFALNTVAFGFGGAGAAATSFLDSALQLNEEFKMAAINNVAVAKYYKFSVEELLGAVRKTAKEIRLNESEVSKATTYLIKAGFNPEMASVSIKRFSDSAVANALNANKAITAAAQGIQQGLSRTLATAGIEENIGPEVLRITRAIKKGEEYYRNIYLTNEESRKQFDIMRQNGKAFREAADAAGRYQFLLRATNVDAGRTAETVNTLTGALNYFKTQRDKAKTGLLEGVSALAVPAINIASSVIEAFNSMPQWAKNTAGLVAATATLGVVTVGTSAGMLALALQTRKVLADEGVLAALRARSVAAAGAYATATAALNTQLTLANYTTARLAAGQLLASKAQDAWNASVARGRLLWASFIALNPAVLFAGIAAGVGLYANKIATDTIKVYDDIEKANKEFQDNLVATRGEEFAGKLNQLMTMMEVKGNFQKQLAEADTPEEQAAAQERIKRADERIQTLRTEMRELNRLRAEKNGDAAATREQAEAYNNLKFTLDGVAERFGDMKLTGFQKDLRSLQTEYTRFLAQVEKASIPDADGVRQITPEQEEKLREQAERLVPEGMAGLVERELDSARKSARAARLEMEREQADLMKDGVAKRKALLSVETRQTREEYAERIKQVRKNMGDPNLQTNASLGPAENKRRMGLLRELANAEQLLFQERDGKIKSLEQKATADLAQIRQERADRMLDLLKGQAQAEVNAVTTSLTTLNLARDRALAGQDEAGRLRVEQNFQRQALGLAKERIEREAGIREGELQTQLARELRDAEALGDGKGRAEALARQRYDQENRTNRQNAVNELAQAELEAQERVSAARVALVGRTVDRELAGIGEIEGAQLAALQRRYARERQLAQARGDEKGAEAYQSALDKVAQEAEGRARDAQKLADDARNSVENLTERLEELNGVAAKGLRGAQIAAEKPFTAYIREREKEIEALNRAKANLVNGSPALRADINRQIAVLNTYVQQATAGRTRASVEAGRAFQQAQFDKIMQERARVAEALYDGGEGDSRAYRAAIAEEATYWRARMRGMEKGSDEYEAARARLEELRQKDAEARNRDALRPLELARQNLTLNEGQQRLAQTEAERNRLMDDRIRLLRQVIELEGKRASDPSLKRSDREQAAQNVLAARSQLQESVTARGTAAASDLRATLATLDAQRQLAVGDAARAATDTQRLRTAQAIAAQDAANAARQNLTLEERRAAEAQALTSQKAVLDIQRAIQDEQNATVRSVRDLAAAQLDYAATVAVTDEQTTNALRDRSALLRTQLADQDALIEQAIRRGDTEASVNALRAERVRLQGQEITTARELAKRPLDIEERRLGVVKELRAAQLSMSALRDDEVQKAGVALEIAQRELEVARQREVYARENGTQADQEKAAAGVATAAAALREAQRNLSNAPVDAAERQLKVLKDTLTAKATISGVDADGVASARLALDFAQRELDVARQRLAVAQQSGTLAEREAAEVGVLTALANVRKAETAEARAVLDVEKRRLDILKARSALQLTAQGGTGLTAAERAAQLEEVRQERAFTEQQLRMAGQLRLTEQEQADLQTRRLTLMADEIRATRDLQAARRADEELLRSLAASEAELRTQIQAGLTPLREIATANAQVTKTSLALRDAQREYALAQADVDKPRLKSATDALTQALANERSAVQALDGEYGKLIGNMDGVRDVAIRLKEAVRGEKGADPFNGNREIDRYYAVEKRRAQALRDTQAAIAGGDRAVIQKAAENLATQEKRYREQQALLRKNGINVSLSNVRQVDDLIRQLDDLGIAGDVEASNLQERRNQLEAQQRILDSDVASWKVRAATETELLSRREQIAATELEAARLNAAPPASLPAPPATTSGNRDERQATVKAEAELVARREAVAAMERDTVKRHEELASITRSAPIDATALRLAQMQAAAQPVGVQAVRATGANATRITNVTVQNTFHTTLNGTTGTSPQEVRMAIEQAISNRIDQASQRKAWEGEC